MVSEGKTIPDTYQAMPTYRVVSGENGPPILSDPIYSKLIQFLSER